MKTEPDGSNEGGEDEAARANEKSEMIAVYERLDGCIAIFRAEGVGDCDDPTSGHVSRLIHRATAN
jgi:hypothetical protein